MEHGERPASDPVHERRKHAIVVVEHRPPHIRHDRSRQDVRQKEQRQHDGLNSAAQTLDHHGNQQTEERARDDGEKNEEAGVDDGRLELSVAEQITEIFEADPLTGQRQAGVGKARRHHAVGRIGEEDGVDEDEGKNERPRRAVLVPLVTFHVPRPVPKAARLLTVRLADDESR